MIMLCLLVKLNNIIDMLYLLRKYYGIVRYSGTVKRWYDHVNVGKF
jgi:hypothetical protein